MTVESLVDQIARELARSEPRRAARGSYEIEAAVALLLRPAGSGLEFLAIKRSECEKDPWSGHMALPGGRRDLDDEDLWQTAVRETIEEVDVDLSKVGRLLGRLDDVAPRSRHIPAIVVTPFVVAVRESVDARTSSEVEMAVWLPLDVVVSEEHRGTLRLDVLPDREFPTIEYGGHVIWGLTLNILRQLEGLLSRMGYGSGARG
ncbi:MAG: CoA pyrophosphatase [Gemmatimonadota bacterium]|nr:MAG: CoA pyrophosphatase [Gemmatimonadota bacterium]